MCLQHSPWEGAVSLIRVRLFVLSKGWKGLCPSSGTPQNSLERHEAIVAGTWSRKKLDLLNGFKILVGFVLSSTSAPKEWVSFLQTVLWLSCYCCCRSQKSCWFLCQGSGSAEVNAELALQLLFSPKPTVFHLCFLPALSANMAVCIFYCILAV